MSCIPARRRDAPEDRVVRAGHPGEQVNDRQADGEQDPVEDVEEQHADAGGGGQQELAAAEGRQPAKPGHIDEPHCGVDDDGPQRRRGKPCEQGPQEQQDGNHRYERDQRVQLGTGAGSVPDAVLLALLLTGKPRNSPAPILVMPTASNSWLALIARSSGRANDRAVSTSSLKATSSTLSPGNSRMGRSSG